MALARFSLAAAALLAVCSCLPTDDVSNDESPEVVSLLQSNYRVDKAVLARQHSNITSDGVVHRQTANRTQRKPPVLIVDLDVEPELRWRNVTKYYMDMGVYPEILLKRSPITPQLRALAKTAPIDDEFLREKRGMFKDMNLPEEYFDYLILAEYGDELSGMQDGASGSVGEKDTRAMITDTGCSAILSAKPDGTVVHGRNMDYGLFSLRVGDKILHYPDVTIEIIFTRGGKPLISSTHWPLHTGFHTAMKFGGWTFEHNTRFHYLDSSIISGLFAGSEGYMLAVRRLMQSDVSFEEAVQQLYNKKWMGPHYFVMAGSGPYEGAILTLDRDGIHDERTPGIRRLSKPGTPALAGAGGEGWHMVQTNDDINKEPSDPRRPDMEVKLSESRQEMVTPEWVLSEMESPPLFHGGTVFSTIYVPSTGYHTTDVHFATYD